MNIPLTKEEQEVMRAVKYQPAVSIILPFEPVESLKTELQHRLKIAMEKVESELRANYPAKKAMAVIAKLKNLAGNLHIDTSKKAIAIYVSPVLEKVFYLDFPVNEKIMIDESFEIRDLVYNKKQSIRYLVLLLSGESSKTYLGNGSGFILLKSQTPENIHAYEKDLPEKVANFSDPDRLREVLLDKFLHHVDQGLTHILKEYPLPVFVAGVQKVLGHFKKMTGNEKSLLAFIHGNYIHASETEISDVLKPYIKEWQDGKEKDCLQQLERAVSENKVEYGIKQVWQSATLRNGRLLLVEKDFMYPAHQGAHPENISSEDLSLNNPFYIKDAVDGAIEKVLAAGGDVEFISNGLLKDYGRIALIKFY